jgi:hypothetical protein
MKTTSTRGRKYGEQRDELMPFHTHNRGLFPNSLPNLPLNGRQVSTSGASPNW